MKQSSRAHLAWLSVIAKLMPDDIRQKITAFFAGNEAKAGAWWVTENPLLGGVSPHIMFTTGREAKLRQWIDTQLAENAAPHGVR